MKSLVISIVAILSTICASAQQNVKIGGGADLVSSYIWRGAYNAGASIQPTIEMNYRGFALGAWGNVDFGGNGKKEVDLSLRYSIEGLTVGITDYWWAGEGVYKYFHYSKENTAHLFEGNLSYVLPFEKFPLSIACNTIFAGADRDENGKRCYSTYFELSYPFSVSDIDMVAKVGAAPWFSPAFLPSEGEGFKVCNVAFAARKSIRCSENFSLPLFSELIFNPAIEDIYLVFGLSLRF